MDRPTTIEVAAFTYLSLPLVIFFPTFLNSIVGWPAVVCLIAVIFQAIKSRGVERKKATISMWLYIISVTSIWMVVGGYGGIFPVNGDWIKDYAIVNVLHQQAWPPMEANEFLRYPLGWYLLPALAIKYTGVNSNVALSVWTFIGLVIFMRMLVCLFPKRSYAIVAPIVFVLFSGMDVIGTYLTGYSKGPPHHIEWWSGWAEFPSNTTSLFWTPQHAIPAWICIALIMRQYRIPTMLPLLPLVFIVICFWSPFVAIGMLAFLPVLVLRYGFSWLFTWQTAGSIVFVAAPLAIYLVSGAASIPHGFVFEQTCELGGAAAKLLCPSMRNYVRFIVLEFAAISVLLVATKSEQQGMLIAASVALLVLPLVHVGLTNDLTMRASIGPLALLAILSANLITSRSLVIVIPLVVLLTIGSFTPAFEAWRDMSSRSFIAESATFGDVTADDSGFHSQYFAEMPANLMRGR